jgi:hypothetical protein
MPAVPVSATDVDRRFCGPSAGWGRQANVLRACPRVGMKASLAQHPREHTLYDTGGPALTMDRRPC